MKEQSKSHFYDLLYNKKKHYPFSGQIELTYRCNLKCIHCYCKGLEDKGKELNTRQWQNILNEIYAAGCLHLVFTGGEPLIRKDFLELYAYAKRKGFIITIFTNAQEVNRQTFNYLTKYPPHCIEITLNGITKDTYEIITQVKDSFLKVMENIKKIKEKKLPIILKSNCLKQNKNEIAKIKAFADDLLGKKRGVHYFKYDPMIYPRLDADKTPLRFRLSFVEMLELMKQDVDIWQEYQQGLRRDFSGFKRNSAFLYRCGSWMNNFFINPYGLLKFCLFSEKFSVDLKVTKFKDGFYRVFPQILNAKFKNNSKCQTCRFRYLCYHCPARAYLETGDEEAPVEYYCHLAKATHNQMRNH